MWKFFFFDIPSDILKNYHFKLEVKVISYANLRKTMDVWIYFIYKKTVKKKGDMVMAHLLFNIYL